MPLPSLSFAHETDNMEVLVGFDGSDESYAALSWAMIEARARGCGVSVVHACDSQQIPHIDDALAAAAQLNPAITVHGSVLAGSPAHTLERLSARAALLVIGRSDRCRRSWLRIGSVVRHVLATSSCPVIAVRPGEVAAPERVVAAIRTQSASEQALRFAFTEAIHHHVPVHVVRLLLPDRRPTAPLALALASSVIRWQAEYPTTAVTSSVPIGAAADSLAATCTSRDLLVLGYHRRGLAPHPRGGHIVDTLHAVPCPVAVIHEPIHAHATEPSAERSPARQMGPAPAFSSGVAETGGPPRR